MSTFCGVIALQIKFWLFDGRYFYVDVLWFFGRWTRPIAL